MTRIVAGARVPPWALMEVALAAEKKAVRARVVRSLRALLPEDVDAQSAAGCAHILATRWWQDAPAVSLFLSMRNEFQTRPLLVDAFARGKLVFVPRVTGPRATDMLMLHAEDWGDVDAFPVSAWGIPEPPHLYGSGAPRLSWQASPARLTLAVLPGVAFDTRGSRVGHGRGYYDAWLAAVRDDADRAGVSMPTLLGAALSCQVLDDTVPHGPTDVTLDAVATPTGVLLRQQVVGFV